MSELSPAHSEKALAAVMAAVQAYLDLESAPARQRKGAPLISEPLSSWKTARRSVLRTAALPQRKSPWRFGAQ